MITRLAQERGHNVISWLDSWHTFSFGQYYDPKWQGFNDLLVINEDYINPSMGFGTHPHKEMEILTYVISGELRHKDSMGNVGIIRPGEIQVMTAGTGVTHSEHSNSSTERTHLLQIWVLPHKSGITPRYDQKKIFDNDEYNFLKVIAAPFNGTTAGVSLNANAKFWVGRYNKSEDLTFKPTLLPNYWIQIIKGDLTINGSHYEAGDALGFNNSEEAKLETGPNGSEFLIIEVA